MMIDAAPAGVTEPLDPPAAPEPAQPPDAPLLESELLVEDVSIDGMCGVY